MKRFWMFAALLAVLALTLAAAACGDDDDDDSGDDGGSEATPTEAASDGGDEPEAQTVAVVIADFAFAPAEFSVVAGAEVTFDVTNDDDVTHTFTVYSDEEFSEPTETDIEVSGASVATAEAGNGEAFEAGEYYFRCELHPTQMMGEFVAE